MLYTIKCFYPPLSLTVAITNVPLVIRITPISVPTFRSVLQIKNWLNYKSVCKKWYFQAMISICRIMSAEPTVPLWVLSLRACCCTKSASLSLWLRMWCHIESSHHGGVSTPWNRKMLSETWNVTCSSLFSREEMLVVTFLVSNFLGLL